MATIALGRIKDSAKVYQYVKDLEKDLGISRYYSRLIQIRFRKDLDDCLGLCWGTEKLVYIDIWKSGDMNQMMTTLAHEMVHAKQFIKKELVDGWMYKGRNYSACDYETQPWEISAYAQEEKLFKKNWKK